MPYKYTKGSLLINFCCSLLIFFLSITLCNAQTIQRKKHFGKNKGHLKMYLYSPVDAKQNMPLVVVLHGCLQCAGSVSKQTGWNKLADEHGFYVLYPQQRRLNNPEKCFRWYKRKHVKKNKGENSSIKNMIDFTKDNFKIDSTKVYITGLSAGAAMAVVMMANYPSTFNAGAIYAGAPYKSGYGMILSMMAMVGWRLKTPQKWGDLVRSSNKGYEGDYPKMIVYQGDNDKIVNKINGVELVEQWTNLHKVSLQPIETIPMFLNNSDIERNEYGDSINNSQVVFYKVKNLGHALIVNPGECKTEGGRTGFFAKDKNYNSTLWTAYDFGLIPTPSITGEKSVKKQSENVSFSVPFSDLSTYKWSFPEGCTILKDNFNSVIVKWGNVSGSVNVIEFDGLNCEKQYKSLMVNVIE